MEHKDIVSHVRFLKSGRDSLDSLYHFSRSMYHLKYACKYASRAFVGFMSVVEEHRRLKKQVRILIVKQYTLGLTWLEKQRLYGR